MRVELDAVYVCEFCGKRRLTKRAILRHEVYCQCLTCRHWCPRTPPSSDFDGNSYDPGGSGGCALYHWCWDDDIDLESEVPKNCADRQPPRAAGVE